MSDGNAATRFAVSDYDLPATLVSGQAFRWACREQGWEGVASGHFVRLRGEPGGIVAETAVPVDDWNWLAHYLQVEVDLSVITGAFPKDEPLTRALQSCRGLRLLRQEPWECLASFILSSSKQIVQIQQIIALLCRRFGEGVPTLNPQRPAFSFPTWDRLAAAGESALRECKMGFRAPYLWETACWLAEGRLNLEALKAQAYPAARDELLKLPGVGPKIADCVLLFAYGFPEAFPVDVWVRKAVCQLYFSGRSVPPDRLRRFIAGYFGPQSGYAQQYLFHLIRKEQGRLPQSD